MTARTASRTRRGLARLLSGVLVVLALGVFGLSLAPRVLGYDLYAITTGSMTGTADPGSLVVARQVPTTALRVGDVITYAPPAGSGVHHLVTHRITEITPDRAGVASYRTKGDANSAVDPWTFTLNAPVQARMERVLPHLGAAVLWLGDPDVRKAAIGLPAVLIALVALADIVGVLRPRPRLTTA